MPAWGPRSTLNVMALRSEPVEGGADCDFVTRARRFGAGDFDFDGDERGARFTAR